MAEVGWAQVGVEVCQAALVEAGVTQAGARVWDRVRAMPTSMPLVLQQERVVREHGPVKDRWSLNRSLCLLGTTLTEVLRVDLCVSVSIDFIRLT